MQIESIEPHNKSTESNQTQSTHLHLPAARSTAEYFSKAQTRHTPHSLRARSAHPPNNNNNNETSEMRR